MKLISITLKDFRQFYNEQYIEFSQGEKNVTIVFGENGKGKTGLFRALIFGLFGQTHLAQDNLKEEIHLVNFLKLAENEGMPITSTVKVEFEEKGNRYIIERSVQGFKMKTNIEERILAPKLYSINKFGNYSSEVIEEEDKVKEVINEIIDEKIKDFFLFDAEKIETLAKTDAHVKEEVKSVIIKLLQIDKLDKAIEILKGLYNKEKRAIVEKSSNLNLINKEQEIDQKINEISAMNKKIEIITSDYNCCLHEIRENEKKLAENEDIRKIQNQYEGIKEKKNDKIKLLDYIRQSLRREHFNNGHKIFMKDSYSVVKEYLNQILVDQKDLISIEIIEKSLNDMICSCCKTNLNDVKEAYENIVKMKNNYRRSELTPLITEINNTIYEFESNSEEINKLIKEKLKEIRGAKDEIDALDKELDKLKESIQKFSDSEVNLKEIERNLESKVYTSKELQNQIQKLNLEIDISNKQLDKLRREHNDLMKQDDALRYDLKKLEYVNKLKNELEKIFKDYSDEMRGKLMEETTSIFKTLIDPKDRDLVESIIINDKYEIEPYNWDKIKVTQDLSQGQKEIMALSFITALAKIAAGGSENVNFPLFMDTPFGRISGTNRDNLIESIPKLTSQWILLVTDTELTISEEIKMKSTNKLGKWYKLNQIKPGQTEIMSINLDEQMAIRR